MRTVKIGIRLRRCRVYQAIILALLIPGTWRGQAQTTIHPTNAWAWAPTIGWVNWRGDVAQGARLQEYICSGYLYAANVGWIHLGSGAPRSGIQYGNASATDYGVNCNADGALSGLAYGANIGWLVFTNRDAAGLRYEGPRVDLRTGAFQGFVFSPNLGWLSLSNALAYVQTTSIAPGTDSDRDGMADAWELGYSGNLTRLTAQGDADGDGSGDLAEYRADTNPLQAGDHLRITGLTIDSQANQATLRWTSKPSRNYQVQQRPDWESTTPWEEVDLGTIPPDAGTNTARLLSLADGPWQFLRVEAIRPLAP